MTDSKLVPKLDLAPKLKRPLSLWNPLDYLLLFYWVFYFPQALHWYEKKWGDGKILLEYTTFKDKIQFLREYPQQLTLWIQGIILTIIAPLLIAKFLELIVNIDWFGVSSGVLGGVVFGVSSGVGFGVAFSMLLSVVFGVAEAGVVAFGVARWVAFSVLLGVAEGVAFSVLLGVGFGVALGVGLGVGAIISALRFEDWFLGSILGNHGLNTFHSTFLPKTTMSSQIKQWLRKDWYKGIDNINQLLEFTLQFIPVINSLNTVLAEIPEHQLIYRISQIAENLYDWEVLKYSAASLANELKAQAIKGFFLFLPYRYLTSHISTDIRLDTPPRAVAAGFWYLHEEEPQKATEAFEKVRTLLYGEEMYQLASILTDLRGTTDTKTIASLNLLSFPNAPLLRPITWQTLTRLRQVKEDIALTLNPQESRLVRNSSLNRAIGELKGIINEKAILPEAERALILRIAQNWLNAVESIALEIGSLTITEPIINPYIIGDPVEGQLFVGREDIFQKMKEIWSNPSHIQSMVLYGHRRMGKTSILRNVNQKIGQNLRLVYVNLQSVGSTNQGVSDILMAISDAIAETLEIEPPNCQDLLDLPERTFENYLKQILREMPYRGLIIALDEFEELETLINEGAIHSKFIKVLRSWIQMNPKLGFILAGLHTLDEMSKDYFSPFFSSFGESLRITFLSPASTRQLLTEPTEDFALRYDRASVEYIHELTYGQAYLVNLIGFRLVSRFNRLRFEQNSEINDIITRDDVNAVVTDEILQRATFYFQGVWNQAAKGAPRQQDILQALAEYPEGREKEELQEELGIENQDLDRAITTLKHHDVIGEDGTKIKILVELFRRWFVRSSMASITNT